jgi:hypothetical protein
MKYNFIEIGTSDFRTLIEKAKPSDVGLSVEPIKQYLDKLPNKPNVTKANYAISEKSGHCYVYYLDELIITEHKLPWYLRGCNSINSIHPTVERWLINKKLSLDIITKEKVKVLSYGDLMKMFNVSSVDFLLLDTEGHDCKILKSIIACCKNNIKLFPKKITFESNTLSVESEVTEILNELKKYKYRVLSRGYDTTVLL